MLFICDITSQPRVEKEQARWKQNCISPAYWYLHPSAYVCLYTEARGVWGHVPPGNFLNLKLWDGYFGAQNITTNLCFSPGMVTGHFTPTHMEISVHRQFQALREQHEGAMHASRLESLKVLSYSKSARSQVSTALFYIQTLTFMRALICTS